MRVLLLFAFLGLINACAITSVSKKAVHPSSDTLLQQHLNSIANIHQFTMQGRIGVQTEGKGFSGGINWQHQPLADTITLYSPLGSQVALIHKTANSVVFNDAKGNSISAADVETLTQNALGWVLPLAGLVDWSLGRPAAGPVQNSKEDEKGHLTTLIQDGWNIEYNNYANIKDIFLPKKIFLKSEKVNLKLIVENWTINP